MYNIHLKISTSVFLFLKNFNLILVVNKIEFVTVWLK